MAGWFVHVVLRLIQQSRCLRAHARIPYTHNTNFDECLRALALLNTPLDNDQIADLWSSEFYISATVEFLLSCLIFWNWSWSLQFILYPTSVYGLGNWEFYQFSKFVLGGPGSYWHEIRRCDIYCVWSVGPYRGWYCDIRPEMCGVPEEEQHRGRHIYLSGKDGEMEGAYQKENSNVSLVILHFFQILQMPDRVLYFMQYICNSKRNEFYNDEDFSITWTLNFNWNLKLIFFNSPETVPRLFDLVKTKEEKILPAFYFALRDTLVANDLDQATRIAYGKTRYRVVTLQGQLLDQSGTCVGAATGVTVLYMWSLVCFNLW